MLKAESTLIQAALARSGRCSAETREQTLRLVVSRVDADRTERESKEEMASGELPVVAAKLEPPTGTGGRMVWLNRKNINSARVALTKGTV